MHCSLFINDKTICDIIPSMSKRVLVKKMDGTTEVFDVDKLKGSLERAGASKDAVEQISEHIEKEIYDGVSTQEIYSHAFEILKHFEKKPVAARYSLKRAVFDLGPSGFPFEQFIGQVFKELGYKNIKSDVYIRGACADHELDFYAEKDGKVVGAELKFHNNPGFKTDLKVVLYVHSRFEDLKKAKKQFDEGWLVTNTRFTKNVINFAQCSGMTLLGWDYPRDRSLLRIIEDSAVHPITALTTISFANKRSLIERNIVTCKQALHLIKSTGSLGVGVRNIEEVKEELESLCSEKKVLIDTEI